jgi:hypothetical protein
LQTLSDIEVLILEFEESAPALGMSPSSFISGDSESDIGRG